MQELKEKLRVELLNNDMSSGLFDLFVALSHENADTVVCLYLGEGEGKRWFMVA